MRSLRPTSRRTERPVGWIIRPDPRGLGASNRSKRVTRLPARARRSAVARPQGPQPATATPSPRMPGVCTGSRCPQRVQLELHAKFGAHSLQAIWVRRNLGETITGAAMATNAAKPRFEVRLTRERLFYSGMALLIFTLVVIGFAPTWFLRGAVPPARPLHPMTPLVMLHGTLFTSWIILFVTQAGLISARQHKIHMKLGLATIALGATMVVVGLLTAAAQVGRGTSP